MASRETTAGADLPASDCRPDRVNGPWSRRRLLRLGLGATASVIGAGVLGAELVDHGVLPGKLLLDQLDGACQVDARAPVFRPVGPSYSGWFRSRARHRSVGYTVALPPGHAPGDELALVVMLHGFGANHENAISGMDPAQALALIVDGMPLAPMGLVTVDGGPGYWHPHRDDDPMGMVVDELVPMLRARGLGRPPHRIGTMGISMGGYGALLLAELFPSMFRAVAAISPAVWTTYDEASAANGGAYDSPGQFARFDAVTHTAALSTTRVRVASGDADPFHPGVVALAAGLPKGAIVDFAPGCHTGAFFAAQVPPSMAFLSQALVA